MMNQVMLIRLFALAVAASIPLPAWCASESPPTYCSRDALDTEVGTDAYTYRDGNRCEGIYRIKISGSRMFVLNSLTTSRSDVQLNDQRDLVVHWRPTAPGVKLRITVVPVNSPVLYRMDTEVDGAKGIFQWSADIVHGRISNYANLGVLASYTESRQTIYVPCTLGDPPGAPISRLTVDIFSVEPLALIEAFSRGCATETDCRSVVGGTRIGKFVESDRNGTFALTITPPGRAEFYSLQILGSVTGAQAPPVAASVVVRAITPVPSSAPVK